MILKIVVLGVVVIVVVYMATRAKTSSNSIGINSVDLSVDRTTASCDGGTFKVTIIAKGYSNNLTPRNFIVKLYDDEAFDDILADYNSTTHNAGISPTLIPNTNPAEYEWSVTHNFTLTCNSDCYVVGPAGSSGESDPKIYAEFKVFFGDPKPTMESARTQIQCVGA